MQLVFTQTGFCVAYLIFIGGNMASLLSIVGGWVYICIALLILVPIICMCLDVNMCLCALYIKYCANFATVLRNMRYLAPFSLLSEVAIFLGMGIVYYYDILHIRSFDDFLQVKMADPWNFPMYAIMCSSYDFFPFSQTRADSCGCCCNTQFLRHHSV